MTNEGSLKSAVEGYLTILQNQGKLIFLRLNAGGIVIEGEKDSVESLTQLLKE